MLNTNKKGIGLAELVISALVLAVIMLGAAGFASDFFSVSSINSEQMDNINQARNINESLSKEISGAAYIYPAGINLNLSSGNHVITINTTTSVAMLFAGEPDEDGVVHYGFTAFFLQDTGAGKADLYQFVAAPTYDWDTNTSPAINNLNFTGSTSKIANDIVRANSILAYVVSYDDGMTDSILLGERSGGVYTSNLALIKGIDWKLIRSNVENQTVKVNVSSLNIPRVIE